MVIHFARKVPAKLLPLVYFLNLQDSLKYCRIRCGNSKEEKQQYIAIHVSKNRKQALFRRLYNLLRSQKVFWDE